MDWAQLGSNTNGTGWNGQFGTSVFVSADGIVMAIGGRDIVRAYAWNGSSWAQRGTDIVGKVTGDLSGSSVSLSADGNVLAIGAPQNDDAGNAAGHVRVYAFDGSAWAQQGNAITGEAAGEQCGVSVSISADGARLAVGSPRNTSPPGGRARVFELGGGVWTQLGGNIDSRGDHSLFGQSLSLSADGTRLAAGGFAAHPAYERVLDLEASS